MVFCFSGFFWEELAIICVPLVIDIGSDITGLAGDITGRKDITRPLVIAGEYDITENRPAKSPESDITRQGSRPRYQLSPDR